MKNSNANFDEFYDECEFERALFSALKERREKMGLSQKDLALKIGIKQSAIARLESGRVNPTLTFLKKIILALDLELTIKENAAPIKKDEAAWRNSF